MSTKSTSFFKKLLGSLLSAACLFSGTAVAGTIATTSAALPVAAAATSDAPDFSWDNATVYFLLTDRFCNGDTSNDGAYDRVKTVAGDSRATFHGGDFAGITKKINEGYFNDLGVNAIWMTAPYEQLHGYITMLPTIPSRMPLMVPRRNSKHWSIPPMSMVSVLSWISL